MSQGQKTLDELKELAKSAVSHALLVQLAREEDKSPNQVKQIAESQGMPRRQAKAARFLAMLRRDYGRGALESFVSDIEHVRAEATATEHAHLEKRKMGKLKARLDLVTDPNHKLRLMLENGMFEKAEAFIEQLVNDNEHGEVYFDTTFQWSRLPEHHFGELPEACKVESKDDTEKARERQARIKASEPLIGTIFVWHNCHGNLDGDENATKVEVDLRGMITKLQWSDNRVRQFVEKVLARVTQHSSKKYVHSNVLDGSTQVCRTCLPADHEVARRFELWVMQRRFYEGRLFELRAHLPTPMECDEKNSRELDPIVDRFAELGMSVDEIREMLLDWIRDHIKNCRSQFILAVAGAKCFDRFECHEERDVLLLDEYLPQLWRDVEAHNGGFFIKMLAEFVDILWRNDQLKDFCRVRLVDLISRGDLSRAYQIILLLGHKIGLFYAEFENSMFQEASKYLKGLLPEAFVRAFDSGKYGIAAALVMHFDKDAVFDEEATKKAVEAEYVPKFDAINEQYLEEAEAWGDGKEDEYFESGSGKEWYDAVDAMTAERDRAITERTAQRLKQIKEVVELAVDTQMPIKLNCLAYYGLRPGRSTN